MALAACGGGGEQAATDTEPAREDRTSSWQAAIDEHRGRVGAPGVVAGVVLDGDAWAGTAGTADTEGTPLRPDARVRIGSVTKTVIAILALDAVAKGEVSLDDPVAPILGDLLPAEPSVTLRMLLNHTSGIFAVGDEGDLAADIGVLTDPVLQAEAAAVADVFLSGGPASPSVPLLVALAETHDRYASPGEGYHYSNVNYLLVGALLERVTGQPLDQLLHTRLVAPLGLRSTTMSPPDSTEPDLVGYAQVEAGGPPVDPGYAHLLLLGNGAAGGIVSTVDELLTVLRSTLAGDVLPPELVEELLTPTPESGSQAYGLGIARYSLSCGTFYGHEGGIAGIGTIAIVSPDGEDGVVVAQNLRGPDDSGLPALADRLLCS